MSDAVRSYRAGPGTGQSGSGAGALLRGGFRLTRYLMIAVFFLGVYLFWISRDTRRIEEFVDADTTFRMVAQNLVENRSRLQETTVWNAVPDEWKSHPLPQLLQTPVGFPEWVQRNLVGRHVFISGRDAGGFTDAVYITKLSRVGSILERMLRFSGGNEGDAAGGLKIRFLREYELFYAIRGRVALASPSRRALIHSLTLSESERVATDWDESIWELGDEDLRGTLRLGGESKWAGYFSAVGFAFRLEQDKGFLRLSLPCTDLFYEAFGEGLRGYSVPELLVAIDGPIQLSANLNGSAAGLWGTLGSLADSDGEFSAMWAEWMAESNPESLASYLAHSLGEAGPGMAIAWHGFEMDTIVPTTDYSMVAEFADDSVGKEIARLSRANQERGLDVVGLGVDEEAGRIEAVDIGGPARTAVLMPSEGGGHVFVSTSKIFAERLWVGGATARYMPERANVYFRISPGEAVERYVEYGTELAAEGLLAGYSAEEFAVRAEELSGIVAGIDVVRIVARHRNGIVEADIEIESSGR